MKRKHPRLAFHLCLSLATLGAFLISVYQSDSEQIQKSPEAAFHNCINCSEHSHVANRTQDDSAGELIHESVLEAEMSQEEVHLLQQVAQAVKSSLENPKRIEELVTLTQSTGPLMRELIMTDPALAYQYAVPAQQWEELPPEVQPLVARQFEESGLLTAYVGCESGDSHYSMLTDSIDTRHVFVTAGLGNLYGNYRSRMSGVAYEELAGVVGMEDPALFEFSQGNPPGGAYSFSYTPFQFHNVTTVGTCKVLYLILRYTDET